MADESHAPAFLALNTNGKIPAIYDPDGPNGTSLALFESGAILLYLADKTGQFISADPNNRYETIQWVMWRMGEVRPMFGQIGFFHKFADKDYEDKCSRDRYATESARLLGVLDERLAGRDWVMGADYSIADISLLGWVRNLIGFYEARDRRLRLLSSYAGVARSRPRAALWKGYQRFYEVDIPESVTLKTWARFLNPVEPMHTALPYLTQIEKSPSCILDFRTYFLD